MAEKNTDLPGIEGPGVSRPKIKAIDKAADRYVEIRDQRMTLTEKEIDAKAVLVQAMKDAGLTEYVYDDYKVILKCGKENVKVRTISEDDEDDED